MASSPFERQVTEAERADDSPQGSSRPSNSPEQFQPTPSFLPYDRPTVRLAELPAWLQSFAAAVGEPPEPDSAAPVTEEMLQEEPEEQEMVSAEPEPIDEEPEEPVREASPMPGVGSGFISEDDLPEWLRSIAPEDAPDAPVVAQSTRRSGSGDAIPVPTVARAWSTSKDARGVDESTSLFAFVASQAPQHALPDSDSGRPAAPSRSGVSEEPSSRVEQYGSSVPPGTSSEDDADSLARSGAKAASGSRLRKFLIFLIIVLVVVLLAAVAATFLA